MIKQLSFLFKIYRKALAYIYSAVVTDTESACVPHSGTVDIERLKLPSISLVL
jgi:hypothetical protein